MRSSLAARVARRFHPFFHIVRRKLSFPGGMASFTFDDFPRSALLAGGAILEKYNLRGTYYAAFGVAATVNDLGQMFGLDDIRTAHLAGHEIACHTYSHLDCSRASVGTILAEVSENGDALNPLLDGAKMTNFAFPFGASTPAGRRALCNRFVSCRGIRPGINHGSRDLTDLLAVRIYDRGIDEAALKRLIDRSRALGGWVIFYTHDVSGTGTPSEFGCTSDQFETIVAYAASVMPVMPVRDVLAGLGYTEPLSPR